MSACRIIGLFPSRWAPGCWSIGSCSFWRSAPAFAATSSFRRLLVLAAAIASPEAVSPEEESTGDRSGPAVGRTGDADVARGAGADFADPRHRELPPEHWTTLLARAWASETN